MLATMIEFIAPARHRQTCAEFAAHHRLYGAIHRAHAAQRSAAQQITADQARNQQQRQRPSECAARELSDAIGHAAVAREHHHVAGFQPHRDRLRARVALAVDAEHAFGQRAHLAVRRQSFRHVIDVAGQVRAFRIEQAVIRRAAQIEFAAAWRACPATVRDRRDSENARAVRGSCRRRLRDIARSAS